MMRRNTIIFTRISLVILLIISAQLTNAQQKPFRFGFKLAPAISWMSPDSKHYENAGSDFTFAWGFTSDFTLMEHYYVTTGFNVSYFKGHMNYAHSIENNYIAYNGQMDRTYNLRYIEVPIALKMKTNELVKDYKFYGLIGVNTGFNIRSKANDHFSGESILDTYTYSEEKIDIKDETTLLKASLLVGVGTEYVIDESVSLVLGINFNNGFTNILKGNNTSYPDIKATAVPYYFELNLGVIF
jgi:hypothetical protein